MSACVYAGHLYSPADIDLIFEMVSCWHKVPDHVQGLVPEGELWIGCLDRALLHGVGLEAVGRGEEVRLQLLGLSLFFHFCGTFVPQK